MFSNISESALIFFRCLTCAHNRRVVEANMDWPAIFEEICLDCRKVVSVII